MKKNQLADVRRLDELIREVRGQKIMLDFDLARVYGVETKSLNRAVKRNADRFPRDFMFQISADEWQNLKYQIGTSSSGHGGPSVNQLPALNNQPTIHFFLLPSTFCPRSTSSFLIETRSLPMSLAVTLTALPSMSLLPVAPFFLHTS